MATWDSARATQTHLRGAERGCGCLHAAHTPHTLWSTMWKCCSRGAGDITAVMTAAPDLQLQLLLAFQGRVKAEMAPSTVLPPRLPASLPDAPTTSFVCCCLSPEAMDLIPTCLPGHALPSGTWGRWIVCHCSAAILASSHLHKPHMRHGGVEISLAHMLTNTSNSFLTLRGH